MKWWRGAPSHTPVCLWSPWGWEEERQVFALFILPLHLQILISPKIGSNYRIWPSFWNVPPRMRDPLCRSLDFFFVNERLNGDHRSGQITPASMNSNAIPTWMFHEQPAPCSTSPSWSSPSLIFIDRFFVVLENERKPGEHGHVTSCISHATLWWLR